MGAKGGFALKFLQWFVRGVQFLCAALILGVYSYFLATLKNHNLSISNTVRAVEGISGAGVLYTLIGLLLLCCVAGLAFTSFIAIALDVAFIGAFIYVAVANKSGAGSCKGYLDTPFGKGNSKDTTSGSDGFTNLPSYHTACRLESACLAVAIIAIVFFVISILVELALVRHHRKEKRFGPGPANNYTSGSGKGAGFFGRFRRGGTKRSQMPADESGLPTHTQPDQLNYGRESYATETTAVNGPVGQAYGGHENGYKKHEPAYELGNQQAGVDHAYGGHGQPPAPVDYRYNDGVYDRVAN